MELVALLSGDELEWTQISGLMTHENWEKIILVGDDNIKNFKHKKDFSFIRVDFSKKIVDLKELMQKKLSSKFKNMEIAVSIASGNGKEHMALVSALINVPVGIRFVALTKNGVTYI